MYTVYCIGRKEEGGCVLVRGNNLFTLENNVPSVLQEYYKFNWKKKRKKNKRLIDFIDELALFCGIESNSMRSIYYGSNVPSTLVLLKLSEYLKVPVKRLAAAREISPFDE